MPLWLVSFAGVVLRNAKRFYAFITSPTGGLISAILVAIISVALFASVIHGKNVERGLNAIIKTLTRERNDARTERNQALTELGTCKANVTTLQNDIKDQNAKIDRLNATTIETQRRAQVEIDRQRAAAAQARQSATKILNGKPAANLTICESAENVLRGREG